MSSSDAISTIKSNLAAKLDFGRYQNYHCSNDSFPDVVTMNQDLNTPQATDGMFAEYPALAALRLVIGDLEELARQGFLSFERRGQLRIHKLRFRRRGRQVVRSIADAAVAAAVKTELDRLQVQRKSAANSPFSTAPPATCSAIRKRSCSH